MALTAVVRTTVSYLRTENSSALFCCFLLFVLLYGGVYFEPGGAYVASSLVYNNYYNAGAYVASVLSIEPG